MADIQNENNEEEISCLICGHQFTAKKNLYRHIRKFHATESFEVGKHICPLCDDRCRNIHVLHNHIQNSHTDVQLLFEEKNFYSASEFEEWKIITEKDTLSKYILHSSGKTLADGRSVQYYFCNRSGFYNAKPKGQCRIKPGGTNKIGKVCPAFMKVFRATHFDAVEITVNFQSTHIGHELDLSKVRLSKQDRSYLASLLNQGLSITDVINICKTYPPTERISITSKKDLYNICRDFKLDRSCILSKNTTTDKKHNHDNSKSSKVAYEQENCGSSESDNVVCEQENRGICESDNVACEQVFESNAVNIVANEECMLELTNEISYDEEIKCLLCDITFSAKKNLYKHIRKFHSAEGLQVGNLLCPVCDKKTRTIDMLHDHFKDVHSHFSLDFQEYIFYNTLDFETWKTKIERESQSSFIKSGSNKKLADGRTVIYYICNRSGTCRLKTGCHTQFKKKQIGTNKIGKMCPASMKVYKSVYNEAVEMVVKFQSFHVGHEKEVKTLRLKKDERKYLAELMNQGISLSDILKTVQKNYSCKHRLGTLTKKDLHNIKRDFKINQNASSSSVHGFSS